MIVQLNKKDERGLKEAWIRDVIQQTAGGLAYCHDLRLIHKDLKDENIMLLEKSVPWLSSNGWSKGTITWRKPWCNFLFLQTMTNSPELTLDGT